MGLVAGGAGLGAVFLASTPAVLCAVPIATRLIQAPQPTATLVAERNDAILAEYADLLARRTGKLQRSALAICRALKRLGPVRFADIPHVDGRETQVSFSDDGCRRGRGAGIRQSVSEFLTEQESASFPDPGCALRCSS